MSAFPHPNLGPRDPDPRTDRRLRLISAISTIVMVGSMTLFAAVDVGPRHFFGDDVRHRGHVVLGLGITLLAGGILLIRRSVRRGRAHSTDH